jgi:hypothetical protein
MNFRSVPCITFHHQNPFAYFRVLGNEHVAAIGLIYFVISAWKPILKCLFCIHWTFLSILSVFQPLLWLILKRSSFPTCVRPEADAICPLCAPMCVCQQWKLRCYRVYTPSHSKNSLPPQRSCREMLKLPMSDKRLIFFTANAENSEPCTG